MPQPGHLPFFVVVWDAETLPEQTRCSDPEGDLVRTLIQKFPFSFETKSSSKKSGPVVLTPYADQAKVLRQLLGNDFVKLIDSAQGSEFDCGILSLGRHDGKIGFMHDRRRMNVAISRFRDQLILLCHRSLLETCPFWSKMYDVWHHPRVEDQMVGSREGLI